MSSRPPRIARRLLVATIVVLAAGTPAGVAEAPLDVVAVAASAGTAAVRIPPPASPDFVSVGQVNLIDPDLIVAVQAAAAAAGAMTWPGAGFGTGLAHVRRNGAVVRAAGSNDRWMWPMAITALPQDLIRRIMTADVAAAIRDGHIVLSATSAALYGVVAGDVLDLVDQGGVPQGFVVGLVAPDGDVNGAEVLMTDEQAAVLGMRQITRVVVGAIPDRAALDAALAARGVVDNQAFEGATVRVRRTWSPPDPDAQIGSAVTKQLLGDFAYELDSNGDVIQDPAYRDAHIVRFAPADIGVKAYCNAAVVADLQAAFTEVVQSGLAGGIELKTTNSAGGCYYPRFSRSTGVLGVLSRHSWGQPIDMNTLSNALGHVPKMDCRIVRIFRKHGFAWGGNFLSSDGMHFEWVGTPRNTLQFPSRYCPNLPDGAIQTIGPHLTQAPTMFAGDGLDPGDG